MLECTRFPSSSLRFDVVITVNVICAAEYYDGGGAGMSGSTPWRNARGGDVPRACPSK